MIGVAALAAVAALSASRGPSGGRATDAQACEQSLSAQWQDRSARFLKPETVYQLQLEMFAENGHALAGVPARLKKSAGLRTDPSLDLVMIIGIWPRLYSILDRTSWDQHPDHFALICREAVRIHAGYVDVDATRPGSSDPIFYVRWTSLRHMPKGYRTWKLSESGENPIE